MKACFITDPLVTTMGAVRPALLLARQFKKAGCNVTLVAPRFDEKIAQSLQAENICLKHVGPSFSFIRSLPTLDAWARRLIRRKVATEICDSDIIINTSSSIMAQADIYYAQGPMTRTLNDILSGMPQHYRYTYETLKLSLRILERGLVKRFRSLSRLFIANSVFCASMYEEWGVKVDTVISPPLDCLFFRPAASRPSADYVLTHSGIYGKEGKISIIKRVADAGVKIKVFGRISSVPKQLTSHPNISLLGRVSDNELVDFYSNALYTLFAFNHEPFGYVPVESMACGTPVLTYDRQGPSETVLDRKTGWLASNDHELRSLASDLWKKGYPAQMRLDSREKALTFDVKEIFGKWVELLDRTGHSG